MTNIQKQDYYFVEILHQAKECFLFIFISICLFAEANPGDSVSCSNMSQAVFNSLRSSG